MVTLFSALWKIYFNRKTFFIKIKEKLAEQVFIWLFCFVLKSQKSQKPKHITEKMIQGMLTMHHYLKTTTLKQIHMVAKISVLQTNSLPSRPDCVHCCVAFIKRAARYQWRWAAVVSTAALTCRPLSRWSWRERGLWAEQLQDAGTEKQVRFHRHQYILKSCRVWRVRFCVCVRKRRRKSRSFSFYFLCKNKTQTGGKKCSNGRKTSNSSNFCEMCGVAISYLWINDGQWYKKAPPVRHNLHSSHL